MTDTLRNMPRYIRNTDAFGWQGADGPNGPWRSITPPQSGTPWQTNASDGRLTPEQIDSVLAKYTDPADARQFLVEAGLIDKNGELAGPYRPSPMDDLRQVSADVSGVELEPGWRQETANKLSPAALSVWCRFYEVVEEHGPPRLGLAAALRAAADQVVPQRLEIYRDEAERIDGDVRSDVRQDLLAIADELEGTCDKTSTSADIIRRVLESLPD